MKRSESIGVNADEQQQQEGTSTLDIARAIHRASWEFNEGRTSTDILLFDNLGVPSQVMLSDMAVAAELIFDHYSHEPKDLQLWNVAETYFEIYTNKHPLSSEGFADWNSAPKDLKAFWYRIAERSLQEHETVKHKRRATSWMEINLQK